MSLVSVVMPYYRNEIYFRDSIASVLNQSYQNLEIILIDDEVTSNSKYLLKEIMDTDNRIKLIINEKNLGAGESRNRAIKIANGKYIAFCDCDDLWEISKLKTQLEFMNKKNADFSFTSYDIIDEKTKKIGLRNAKNMINYEQLIASCDIGLSTIVLNKKIFNENCKFAKLKTKEDYVFWLKLSKMGIKMFGLNQILASWRKSDHSLSSSIIQKLLDGFRVYHNYMKFNVIKSLFCLVRLSINFILKK